MKLFYVKALLLCSSIWLIGSAGLYAQSTFWDRSNVGISAGVMNYAGYMNNTPFTFKNAKFAGELMYRYDISDQFHIRGTLLLSGLSAQKPGLGSFNANIGEAAILPEYDFINIRVGTWNYHNRWTPYIYAGPAFYRLFHYQVSEEANGKTINEAAFNLRWGIGVKYAVRPGIQLFLDGSRREFSKHIDFYDTPDAQKYKSRYYSIMLGAVFSLTYRKHSVNW